ncbi:replication region DNA-binding N-term [Polaromonas sp. OV174]|uniref:DNA-binding protein n=1 Tax=Polaromonas sp. OV174 TaxID=1855300 RepID=UPI0008F04BC4|nr:DNA-binding protein [Polaromonas sp. OV174]SFC24596.1 replication region DNA-binding N-term [Polaromonas sp. OV174]
MQIKSPRGVQQVDVWSAADALVAEGLRPTIERVRQKMGRGSPNTVSPLLEAWFGTLAGRLGVGGSSKDEAGNCLPEPVQRAALMLWEAARLSAREEAAQEFSQARQALAGDRAELEQRAVDLQKQQQALRMRQLAVDEALQVARTQISDMTIRLEQAGALQNRRDREIDELRVSLTAREKERDADRLRNEEEGKRHSEERARLEARATANERRLLEELDRERQESKQAKAALLEAGARAQALQTKQEAANTAITASMQTVTLDLAAERQALALAQQHIVELGISLDHQKMAHAVSLRQLNLLLANSTRKPLVRPPILRRRI